MCRSEETKRRAKELLPMILEAKLLDIAKLCLDIPKRLNLDNFGQKFVKEVYEQVTICLKILEKSEEGGEGHIMSTPTLPNDMQCTDEVIKAKIENFTEVVTEARKLHRETESLQARIMVEVFGKGLIELQAEYINRLENK